MVCSFVCLPLHHQKRAIMEITLKLQQSLNNKENRLAEILGKKEAKFYMERALKNIKSGTKKLTDVLTEEELKEIGF